MKVLLENSVTYTNTKDYINEKLDENHAMENIWVEEVIYFSLL